jgi:hypothetical protein
MSVAAFIDCYVVSGAGYLAVVGYAASAKVGYHMAGLGAFITGDGNDLDGILGSVIFAETDPHAFCDYGSVLIYAAAHGRFAFFCYYISDIVESRESVMTLPCMAGKLS